MDAIDKIISQINETAHQERMILEETKRREIDQDFEAQRLQLEKDAQKQKAKQLEDIEKKYRQLRNRQQVESRQKILNEKQEFLQRLFTEATTQLENRSKEEQLGLMKKMLHVIPIKGKVRLLLGEKTAGYFIPALIEQWNEEFLFEMVLDDRTIKKEAGFIIDDQGIQYNFLYSNLIKEIQDKMRFEIAQQLFD